MHKLFISLVSAGCVLFSGLVSCSKETTHTDTYHAKPPVIRSASGSYDLAAWDELKIKTIDAQDSFDFTESAPARVAITAQCRGGGEHSNGQSLFRGVSQVQIWQALPLDLLTAALNSESYECSFVISLINAAGSKHIYDVAQVSVVDLRPWPVEIAMNNGDPLPPGLLSRRFPEVSLRYQNSATAAAKILCRNIETQPIPFERVIDFSHFNFKHVLPLPNNAPDILEIHPRQDCRAVILQSGSASAMSRLVTLQITPPPFQFVPLAVPNRKLNDPIKNEDEFVVRAHRVYAREPMLITRWRVENTSQVPRILRLPKTEFGGMVVLYQRFLPIRSQTHSYGGWQQMNLAMRAMRLVAEDQRGKIAEDAATVSIKLAPSQALMIDAIFQSHSDSTCADIHVPPPNFIKFAGFAPPVIEEVAVDGSLLETYSLPFPERGFGFAKPSAKDQVLDAHPCEWN